MKKETINQIREFNRFYTVLLGFLSRNYLDSGYSVTETRILFELKQHKQLSANHFVDMLHLDKSYISRIIRDFERKDMITRKTASDDRRTLVIQLTSKGEEEADKLIAATNSEIYRLIEPLDTEACNTLCQAMKTIMNIFTGNHSCSGGTS